MIVAPGSGIIYIPLYLSPGEMKSLFNNTPLDCTDDCLVADLTDSDFYIIPLFPIF